MFEEEISSGKLVGLKEIRLPEPVSYAPDTAAWWVLLVVLLLLLALAGVLVWRRWQRGAYRRAALGEIAELRGAFPSVERRPAAIAALPVLLKRTALEAWPRPRVASLTGDEWARFLDDADGAAFDATGAALLQRAAYGGAGEMTATEAESLAGRIEAWIRGHRV